MATTYAGKAASPVSVPSARVALSLGIGVPGVHGDRAFELAARLGYDAVEVMVGVDPLSQDIGAMRKLVDYHQVPSAPCMLPAC